jgi:hypothetical protein
MSSISWTNASGGTWTVGSNWSGGEVPGSSDSVTISVAPAAGLTAYAVDITTNVAVDSITLDQAAAILDVGNAGGTASLSTTLDLQAGTLALSGGTLSGLVDDTGGTLDIAPPYIGDPYASGLLQNVTWEGDLHPYGPGYSEFSSVTLDVSDGLTLTGANGNGPGTLTLDQSDFGITFLGNQTFDNATVYLGTADGGFGAPYLTNQRISGASTSLTLGSHLLIDATANGGAILDGGQIVNDGTISTTGTASLSIQDGSQGASTFTNNGQITVNSGGAITLATTNFINAGTLNIGAGGSLSLNESTYSPLQNTGTLFDDGLLSLNGSLTTAQLQALNVTYGAAGALQLFGTLVNTGANLVLGTGGAIPSLELRGTILGGTLTAAGSTALIADYGTLDGVTVDGPLSVSGDNVHLNILNGLQLGAGGTVTVTGTGASLNFSGTQTLNDGVIVLGGGATLQQSGTGTVTLAAATQIRVSGGSADIGGVYAGGTVIEQGGITVTNGALLALGQVGSAVINHGRISVTGGSTLFLDNGYAGTGAVSLKDSTLLLGSLAASALRHITLNDSTVALVGTLNAAGDTLNIGAGTALGDLRIGLTDPDTGLSDAAIVGGTINDAGGGLQFFGTTTLAGVTYQGVLAITSPYANVTLDDITLQDITGQHPGTLVLSGAAAVLELPNGSTLDNATVDIGSAIDSQGGVALAAPDIVAQALGDTATAVLGAHLTIDQTATYAAIGASTPINGPNSLNTIVNDGAINARLAGGTLTLNGGSFLNDGSIAVGPQALLTAAAATLVNDGAIAVGSHGEILLNLLNYYQAPQPSGTSFENAGRIGLTSGIIAEQTAIGIPAVAIRNDTTGQDHRQRHDCRPDRQFRHHHGQGWRPDGQRPDQRRRDPLARRRRHPVAAGLGWRRRKSDFRRRQGRARPRRRIVPRRHRRLRQRRHHRPAANRRHRRVLRRRFDSGNAVRRRNAGARHHQRAQRFADRDKRRPRRQPDRLRRRSAQCRRRPRGRRYRRRIIEARRAGSRHELDRVDASRRVVKPAHAPLSHPPRPARRIAKELSHVIDFLEQYERRQLDHGERLEQRHRPWRQRQRHHRRSTGRRAGRLHCGDRYRRNSRRSHARPGSGDASSGSVFL